eukprot:6049619-Pyramimonas_sp.AAC.1
MDALIMDYAVFMPDKEILSAPPRERGRALRRTLSSTDAMLALVSARYFASRSCLLQLTLAITAGDRCNARADMALLLSRSRASPTPPQPK